MAMSPSSDDGTVELRQRAPRAVIDVIDAVSAARRMERWELITQILSEWASDRQREAQAITRVTRQDKA